MNKVWTSLFMKLLKFCGSLYVFTEAVNIGWCFLRVYVLELDDYWLWTLDKLGNFFASQLGIENNIYLIIFFSVKCLEKSELSFYWYTTTLF